MERITFSGDAEAFLRFRIFSSSNTQRFPREASESRRLRDQKALRFFEGRRKRRSKAGFIALSDFSETAEIPAALVKAPKILNLQSCFDFSS